MGIMLTQVTIPRDNGLAKDAVVNTFNFSTVGVPTLDHAESASAMLLDFYNAAGATQASTIAQYLSGTLNAAESRLKCYDLSDPEPRTPIWDDELPITNNASTNPLPSEVALCLSYKADAISGVPAARLRGRVYIGPFTVGPLAGGITTNDGRPVQGLIDAMVDAGVRLYTSAAATVGDPGTQWAVFSQVPDPAARPVTGVWVDNAFDTQRRRGVAATYRTTG